MRAGADDVVPESDALEDLLEVEVVFDEEVRDGSGIHVVPLDTLVVHPPEGATVVEIFNEFLLVVPVV